MIIAINTRLNKEVQPQGYHDFLFGLLDALTKKYPEHHFLYIFDKSYDDTMSFAKNVQPVIAGPETRTSLRLQYWFNYKIPAVLRKHKADVFVSLEGICSMRTRKPQCLLVSDLSFLQADKKLRNAKAGFFKKYSPAFLAKAASVATVSAYSKTIITNQYKINAADIAVIDPGIDEHFKPIDWTAKEIIKEKYTEGKAYFLFSGDINRQSNTINLLKAFSFFKKRQKSNMQLVIAGKTDESFKNELKTYKLRSAVILLEDLPVEELAKITAAAYAMVLPVLYSNFSLPALHALACETPLIASNTAALPDILGKAALYINPNDFEDIAENMMLIFKDEDKASVLTNAGKLLASQYQWDKSAELLMQAIQKAYDN